MNSIVDKDGYNTFLTEIKDRIRKAQYEALKSVNKELINLYWDIGRMIVERQGEYGWGKAVVENLSKDLRNEYPGIKGFSIQNLWYMRQFYLDYKDNQKLQPLVGEISWSKNLVIMGKSKNRTIVEYTLKDVSKPIGISTYKILKELPENLSKYLSSEDEIAEKLKLLED